MCTMLDDIEAAREALWVLPATRPILIMSFDNAVRMGVDGEWLRIHWEQDQRWISRAFERR